MDYEPVSLENINGGAAVDYFDHAMRTVMKNIADANTPTKKSRKIVMEFSFTPNEDRSNAEVKISVQTKLAQPKGHEGFVLLHYDGNQLSALRTDPKQQELISDDPKITNIGGVQ